MDTHSVLITGAAGYVGSMLVEKFISRDDVSRVVGVDREAMPESLSQHQHAAKISWVQADTSSGMWQETARAAKVDVVVHAAWQIREMYGKKTQQRRMNIDGSNAVFEFALRTPGVKRFVHFSTVASYGAFSDNEIDRVFKEEDGFRESLYMYAEEKREVEESLKARYDLAVQEGVSVPVVTIIRPAAITGPRGRFARIRFGLQSALSGQLKTSRSIWHRLVSKLVSFTPVTQKWCRQFIHEDDIRALVEAAAFNPVSFQYEAFNAAPPGPVVTGADMARAVGKKPVLVPPVLIRMVFAVLWHASRGAIPTSKGGWMSYSFPIVVDGSKATRLLGMNYRCDSLTAFTSTKGDYEYVVPVELRK
jgi:nucleoside-diphosphate-sugar epimerase